MPDVLENDEGEAICWWCRALLDQPDHEYCSSACYADAMAEERQLARADY